MGSLALGTVVFSWGMEAGDQSRNLAKQGWLTFQEVLAGDQGKLELALKQLEQAAAVAPADVHNLFTLGRAYFYDAITLHHLTSAVKAERAFARVLEIDPKHNALAFHGSVLAILAQGKDPERFRKGIREMNQNVQQNPDSLNGRFSRALTALALPPKARAEMRNYDPAEDLEIASLALAGIEFHYAPHAEVGSKAFVGEAYLLRGDVAKAQAAFKAALAVPPPSEEEAKAGRVLLCDLIQKRLDGSEQRLTEMLGTIGLGTCNTCHLRISGTVQSKLKTGEKLVGIVKASLSSSRVLPAAQAELKVDILGLRSSDGQLRVALFDSEKTFLQNPFKASAIAIEHSRGHWQVKGLPPGPYALAVYHDRNNNGKLDSNRLGMPFEPYAFSNNARGIMGPPSFGDARFKVVGPQTRIEVSLE
jgi:uncharacterized protein (DUF2141 family)/cytochrome c-type biogenesis protein CcmH/NrfG